MEPLVDSFGRVHRDLRISITDRCNFRCTYCMPEEGMTWLPRADVLSFEEIVRLAGIFRERVALRNRRLPARAASPFAGRKPELSITTNGATFRLVAP